MAHDADIIGRRSIARPTVQGTSIDVRVVATVTGGWCKGERLNGRFAGAAGDWLLVGADGFARLNVRGQLVTDDGAAIFLSYNGLLECNQRVVAAAGGGETQFEDQYFHTLVRRETGAPAYAWVNTSLFVGRGRTTAGGVEYELFRSHGGAEVATPNSSTQALSMPCSHSMGKSRWSPAPQSGEVWRFDIL